MNIAIFTNNYLPNPYGVSGSIESFRKQFEKRGHAMYIFAPKFKNYKDNNPNVFRYPAIDIEYKIKFPIVIPYSSKINEIIEGLNLDIIHSQHPNLLGSVAEKWAKKKNIPLVFTWHTLYDQYVHFFPLLPKKLSGKIVINQAVKYANQTDQIIVPTPGIKNIIQNWGVTNKNIEAIPTGIEEALYQNADRDITRKKYNIKDDEILLLLVSRLTQEKNIEFLFDSVIKVLKNNTNTKFLIAGDGYLLPKLKVLPLKNKLSDKIIFEEIVPKENLKNYYAAGDIFVYASKSETQGMIVSEAMYMGLPIVAVDAPGICDLVHPHTYTHSSANFSDPASFMDITNRDNANDVIGVGVKDNVNGFLTSENTDEFSTAIHKLIDNKELRKTFGEASKQIARENFTDSICAEKMLKVYESLIKK